MLTNKLNLRICYFSDQIFGKPHRTQIFNFFKFFIQRQKIIKFQQVFVIDEKICTWILLIHNAEMQRLFSSGRNCSGVQSCLKINMSKTDTKIVS